MWVNNDAWSVPGTLAWTFARIIWISKSVRKANDQGIYSRTKQLILQNLVLSSYRRKKEVIASGPSADSYGQESAAHRKSQHCACQEIAIQPISFACFLPPLLAQPLAYPSNINSLTKHNSKIKTEKFEITVSNETMKQKEMAKVTSVDRLHLRNDSLPKTMCLRYQVFVLVSINIKQIERIGSLAVTKHVTTTTAAMTSGVCTEPSHLKSSTLTKGWHEWQWQNEWYTPSFDWKGKISKQPGVRYNPERIPQHRNWPALLDPNVNPWSG